MEKEDKLTQKKITDFYSNKSSKKKEDDIEDWKCVVCGISMGKCNPRQYCEKTYCPYDENF